MCSKVTYVTRQINQLKRTKKQLIAINKKIKEILENPHYFKPLKKDMKGPRRVHFVLIYEIDEKRIKCDF